VQKILKKLKTFLSEAEQRGFPVPTAYRSRRFSVSASPSTHIYLTDDDLSRIAAFQADERLGRVRDLLIAGCRTGLRWSDWVKVRAENIRQVDGVSVLFVETEKTGQAVSIPVHPQVSDVRGRWGGDLPLISQQKFNDYVKELCREAGVKEWRRVSSHTCRRTFATLAYRAGLPLLSIAKITGHSSERVLLAYIRVTGEENAVEASRNKFFSGE
jgi:integrase